MILQRLWQLNCDWDNQITGEVCELWTHWRAQIHNIQTIKIPRKIMHEDASKTEVHGFCDASEAAYGACIYLRCMTPNDQCVTRLLCAKSRIAPLKKLSLLRLELCSAVLLAHLAKKVTQALSISINQIYYWSNSTITLSWIASEPNRWNTFVANRTTEIHRITDKNAWYHVGSKDNPADILSRGINPDKLKTAKLWWEGPTILQQVATLHSYKGGGIKEDMLENAPLT